MLIRPWSDADSIPELTALLHRAYSHLAAMGLNFVATNQADMITQERIENGECFLAELNGRVVGTCTFYPIGHNDGNEWYERDDVATLGQFAVEPELQGMGIGSKLLDMVERRALESGAAYIALDTAEPAEHLIQLYVKRGYRFVQYCQWESATYRSVILTKETNAAILR